MADVGVPARCGERAASEAAEVPARCGEAEEPELVLTGVTEGKLALAPMGTLAEEAAYGCRGGGIRMPKGGGAAKGGFGSGSGIRCHGRRKSR